jgi:hypothetical protein
MNKVIVRIRGGLGNQLFCYATARRLALVNEAVLVIDDVTGFIRDRQYNRRYALDRFQIPARKATHKERMEPFERCRRGVAKLIARRQPFNLRRYIEQEGKDFDPRLLDFNVKGTIYLDGLWQSEGYFKDAEQTIREDLCIIPPIDRANIEMATHIRDCVAVAVHVRFFDAPSEAGTNNAPAEYYARAVAHMQTLVPGAHYFIFSDQPDAARTLVPLSEGGMTCVSHNRGDSNAYADLWLMTLCNHFIIANSTFSWWGAWLGHEAAKHVIAPGFRLSCDTITSWNFFGQLPNEWLKL